MNKAELVSAVAEKSGQTASAVGSVLSAFEDVITDTVAGGGKVQLPGFLTFERTERSARTGRNPSTGEEIQIAAATVPKVKVGKTFKDAVNK
ncbi:MAG TPA: HU family DNA-binding protein [Acidimicrobiales bacterium]